MDDATRSEYPSMLENLQPNQAVHVLNDRVKRINKINSEIADWLQERRRVEDQYVQGLRKLAQFKVPNHQSELGVFQAPWDRILGSIEAKAESHTLFASRVEKDVETPLRGFQSRSELQTMNATSGNLASMARDLEDAQKKFDTLNKKGGKANAQKLDAASTKLESATQQWDSQAPFIFESLQAIDEQRVNHLRDLLTQFQTHESDNAERGQTTAGETLAAMLEISTETEIASFKEKVVAGKPKVEKKAPSRQTSNIGSSSHGQTLPPPPNSAPEDTTSDNSTPAESRPETQHESPRPELKTEKTGSNLRSKIGTMLGRRRQSIHGGFGSLSPAKGAASLSRATSSHGRPGLSPRTSTNNMAESNSRLAALSETPDSPLPPKSSGDAEKQSHEGTNGITEGESTPGPVNGTAAAIFDAPPPSSSSGPGAPGQENDQRDEDGFKVPPPANDPISQAQREAAEENENEQLFKLNISSSPIAEEDPEASKAAMSNVASTLTKMSAPSRKMGTVRGRRDVRNTIYAPAPPAGVVPGMPELTNENPFPAPPPVPGQPSQAAAPAVAALASQASIAGTSDSQSIRSGNSLGSLAYLKHPEMHGAGLNASIVETVSATFEDGVVKSAKINGEIAFSHNADSSERDHETIRINNFPSLEAIGPNRIFVNNASSDHPDQFSLDLSHINKTTTAFTYRVHSPEADAAPQALTEHVPLMLHPVWKPQGDKLGLLLQYSLNPACRLSSPVTLHNVVFVATYEGARASGAQTKPSGTHLKDKHLLYWRLGDVTLTPEYQKIVCRVIGAEGTEPKPGHVEARWEYVPPAEGPSIGSTISVARLEETKGKEKESDGDNAEAEDDPFADSNPGTPALPADQRWTEVPLVKKVVSGKYDAKSA